MLAVALSILVSIGLGACNKLFGIDLPERPSECDAEATCSQPPGDGAVSSAAHDERAGAERSSRTEDDDCDSPECLLTVRPRCSVTQTKSCGGDPRGTWVAQELCSLTELSQLVGGSATSGAASCAASYHWAEHRVKGVLQVLADGRVTTDIRVATDMEADIPEACLASSPPSPEECTAKAERVARESLIAEASCQPDGTACQCLFVTAAEGWFNAAVLEQSLSTQEYCVDGSHLRIQLNAETRSEVLELERVADPLSLATSCARGVLIGQNEEPAAGLMVALGPAEGPTSEGPGATANEAGEFCLNLSRQDPPGYMYASSGDADRLEEWGLQLEPSDVSASCGADATRCQDLGRLKSQLLLDDCDGEMGVGDGILLLASGQQEADASLKLLLEGEGYPVTLGPHHSQFDGAELENVAAVYLRPALDYMGDMPLFGQRALARWVSCGGALLTSEWTVWKFAIDEFSTLQQIHPANGSAATGVFRRADIISYVQNDADPVIHAGMPERFTFEADNVTGSETWLEARAGASVFWSSENYGAGVLGWEVNRGRVLGLSTMAGPLELANPNYRRLLVNAFAWLATRSATPEPEEP